MKKNYRIIKEDDDLFFVQKRFFFLWCIPTPFWTYITDASGEFIKPAQFGNMSSAEEEIDRRINESRIITYEFLKSFPTADKIIPTITHELGAGWRQPDRKKIFIGDKFAFMTEKTLKELYNYSGSIPTGVYEGKMWRSESVIKKLNKTINYLRWWTVSEDPNKCKNEVREVSLITESDYENYIKINESKKNER